MTKANREPNNYVVHLASGDEYRPKGAHLERSSKRVLDVYHIQVPFCIYDYISVFLFSSKRDIMLDIS